jgi:hypothetical protein
MTTPIPLTQALTAVQNGTLAQAIADVCAERDRLRKENAILQEANRGLAEQGDRLRAQVEQLRSEVYEQPPEGDVGFPGMTWKEAAEQAGQVIAELRAQCAAMRSALEKAAYELNIIRARDGVPWTQFGTKSGVCPDYFSSVVDECQAALANACELGLLGAK